jgi:signal transduction histidine kinase
MYSAMALRPALGDRLLAGLVVIAVAAEAAMGSHLPWLLAVVFGSALAAASLLRRTVPLLATALAFGSFLVVDLVLAVLDAEPVTVYSGVFVLPIAYSLVRWGSGRDIAVGSSIVAAEFLVSVSTDFTGLQDALGGATVLLLTAAMGMIFRYRAQARHQLVEQARLQERENLARELHDTVAHHVSAVAIQAQAGLLLAQKSSLAGAIEALEIINREAAETLVEMRMMVDALRNRDQHAPVTPPRRLADIERIATSAADSFQVEIDMRGNLADLSPTLQATLYRIVQESITNAQRHAHHATRVRVTITGTDSDIQVDVTDDGTRVLRPVAPHGYGLVGMAERVALHGGELTTGPGPSRGWRVHVTIPRAGQPRRRVLSP